jgi:hypothetical protein
MSSYRAGQVALISALGKSFGSAEAQDGLI